MEWIGTGFVLTVGGVRLRVRIALEDTPERPPARDERVARAGLGAGSGRSRVHGPRG